jgi:hypothetical protein
MEFYNFQNIFVLKKPGGSQKGGKKMAAFFYSGNTGD